MGPGPTAEGNSVVAIAVYTAICLAAAAGLAHVVDVTVNAVDAIAGKTKHNIRQ